MASARDSISVDLNRLEELCELVLKTAREKGGIFREGFSRFLPQYSIPKELDPGYPNPESLIPEQNKLQAAQYLWTLVLFERRNQSRQIIRWGANAYSDQSSRWIFSPEKVALASLEEIKALFKQKFPDGSRRIASDYLHNTQTLVKNYQGDPRALIQGLPVEEARKRLMEFKGIGTGIANLYIIYLLDRKLASPSDPENMMPKIDVHKARIPLQCGAMLFENHPEVVRRDLLVKPLEQAYRTLCQKRGWNINELDAALWIIGSEICAKLSYPACAKNCPLVDKYCRRYIKEDDLRGVFVLSPETDLRKRRTQRLLEFMYTGTSTKAD